MNSHPQIVERRPPPSHPAGPRIGTVLAVIAAIWAVTGAFIHVLHATRPTANTVSAALVAETARLKAGSGDEEAVGQMAARINRLTFEERERLQWQHWDAIKGFINSLPPPEQMRFLDLILPTDFQQLFDNLNKMPVADRRRWIDRAMSEVDQNPDGPLGKGDDPNLRKFVNEALSGFYSDANIDVKLELAPMLERIEQLQRSNQD